MDKQRIEAEARKCIAMIWGQIPEDQRPTSLSERIALLNPEYAAYLLGYHFEYRHSLGRFGGPEDRFEVAGILDREKKLVAISEFFPQEVQLFTAAHELAHIVLHKGSRPHRDRPVGGAHVPKGPRTIEEQEADYFAACFTMPRGLLQEAVERYFGCKELVFNENTAFWLGRDGTSSLLFADADSLERQLVVAAAERYGTVRFDSLAKQFGVSVRAMAIQLREFGLVKSYP